MRPPGPVIFAVYRSALALYPSRFRLNYREQMIQTLLDAHRDRSAGVISFWFSISRDLVQSICREHMSMFRDQVLAQPIFFHALGVGMLLTLLGGAGALTMQHMLRHGANQPQTQMASFYASEIEAGKSPEDVIPPASIDLERSLEPFVIFYDDQGRPEISTGRLNRSIPAPPRGVFDYARAHGSDTLTWQPQANVRIASITQRVDGPHPGFLLVGRSLRTVEEDESFLYRMTFFGWFTVMLLLAAAAALLTVAQRGKPSSSQA